MLRERRTSRSGRERKRIYEDKVRNGCIEEKREIGREGGRKRGDEERHRGDVYDSGALPLPLPLRSMCQCASRWRPAEVDGLAFGRRRRRSAALGTRSVMESLAAPSVEAMTPSTPLPATERPAFSPPLPCSASLPRAAPVTPPRPRRDGSAAPPSLRSSSPYPGPRSCLSSNLLVVTPATRERDEK